MTRLLAFGSIVFDAAGAMLHFPSVTSHTGVSPLLLLGLSAFLPLAYRGAVGMLATLEETPEVLPALQWCDNLDNGCDRSAMADRGQCRQNAERVGRCLVEVEKSAIRFLNRC